MKINLEFYNASTNKYEVFQSSSEIGDGTEYISIPIASLLQSYIIGEIEYSSENYPMLLSASSDNYNFSRISINDLQAKLEVFYSK